METLLQSTATQGLGVVLSIVFVWYMLTKNTKMLEQQQKDSQVAIKLMKLFLRKQNEMAKNIKLINEQLNEFLKEKP